MDIVEQMRSFESDHEPDGWPAIQMKQVSALCDEVERLNSELNTLQAGINCTGYSVDQAVANFKYWIAEHDRSQSLLNGMASEVERLQSLLEQERQKSLTSSCRVAALEMELDSAHLIPAQQSLAVVVPDGWILVPKMLTGKMYDAIVRVADNRDFISWPANIWESACDASPNPPTSKLLRVTEHDAREIALSAWRYWMNNCDRTVDNWIEDEGLDLTNKLNGVTNETN